MQAVAHWPIRSLNYRKRLNNNKCTTKAAANCTVLVLKGTLRVTLFWLCLYYLNLILLLRWIWTNKCCTEAQIHMRSSSVYFSPPLYLLLAGVYPRRLSQPGQVTSSSQRRINIHANIDTSTQFGSSQAASRARLQTAIESRGSWRR